MQSNLQQAFATLIQQHEKLVYKVCHLYAADDEDIRDLFQEIVLQAWNGYARYRGDAAVSTWLYRVALNTAITHQRRQRNAITTTTQLPIIDVADDGHVPYAEEYRIMHKLIGELPPLDKALVLLYFEDRTHAEIAEILGISTSNVGTKLNRIKDRLRKQAQPLLNN